MVITNQYTNCEPVHAGQNPGDGAGTCCWPVANVLLWQSKSCAGLGCGTLEMYNDMGDSLCHLSLGYENNNIENNAVKEN